MKTTIVRRGFLALIVTQFFGAVNDNILKGVLTYMVIQGIWEGDLGKGGQGYVGLCFTLPFIVLSGYGGQFADRNSKRYVSVLVKVVCRKVRAPNVLLSIAVLFLRLKALGKVR